MRLRGVHDIKTHGSLARGGRLVSVARDWHGIGNREAASRGSEDETASGGWSAERHVYPERRPDRPRATGAADLRKGLFLRDKARLHQIEGVKYFLREMRQAIAEGIPVAMREFERLTRRLAELEAG